MIFYLYISKLKNPGFKNPKINDYDVYELDIDDEFISGLALACRKITSIDKIHKYMLISENNKNLY